MKFKLDENLPPEGADVLRAAGHDVMTVLEQGLGGTSDPALFSIVRDEGRVLVTLDGGFGDIREYPPGAGPGIVVLRLKSQSKPAVMVGLAVLAEALAAESLAGKLWILEADRLRIRG